MPRDGGYRAAIAALPEAAKKQGRGREEGRAQGVGSQGEIAMASKHWRVGVAVALGLLVPATAGWADGAAAVQAVKNLGGHVEVDAQRPGKPVVTVTLHGIQVTDSGLQGLPTTPPSRGSRGAPLSPPRPVPTTKESRIPLTDRVTFLPSARASN